MHDKRSVNHIVYRDILNAVNWLECFWVCERGYKVECDLDKEKDLNRFHKSSQSSKSFKAKRNTIQREDYRKGLNLQKEVDVDGCKGCDTGHDPENVEHLVFLRDNVPRLHRSL